VLRIRGLRICGLTFLTVLVCLRVLLAHASLSLVPVRPSAGKPADSPTFQYEIPYCSIDGTPEKNSRVSGKLEEALTRELGNESSDRVAASNAPRYETEAQLRKRKGTFDIIIIEEETQTREDKVKVIRGKLRIEAVSPVAGHRSPPPSNIETCILQPDEADDSRCTAELVEEIKQLIIAHDKDCHRGNPCSQ
jgi:hypothetical protein